MFNRIDKKSWRWSAGSLAGIAMLGLAALWANEAAAEKITIGALRFTSHSPTFIAKERGYFKKEGLDVELKFFQAAQPIAVAIASGDIDFGVTALTGGFYNLADKGALKVIGGLYTENPKHNGMAIMVSNKAYKEGVTSPEAIKGRSWAMTQQGSSFHYMIGMIGAKHGFGIADVKVKPLQKVDAMSMVPHVAIPLSKAGAAKIIGWVRDLGSYQVTTIFTSTDNVQNHRAKVERFMRAYSKGIGDYRAVMLDQKKDPGPPPRPWWTSSTSMSTRPGPAQKAAPSIKAGAVYMTEGAALDIADLKRQLAWFQAQGFAPKTLTTEKYIDSSFVKK